MITIYCHILTIRNYHCHIFYHAFNHIFNHIFNTIYDVLPLILPLKIGAVAQAQSLCQVRGPFRRHRGGPHRCAGGATVDERSTVGQRLGVGIPKKLAEMMEEHGFLDVYYTKIG